MNQPSDSKLRIIFAWITWFLMLIGSAISTFYFLIHIVLFYLGGLKLIEQVWSRTEDKTQDYSSILLPLIFISMPLGAKTGVWLWGKLARKFKLISDSRIRKMLGQ